MHPVLELLGIFLENTFLVHSVAAMNKTQLFNGKKDFINGKAPLKSHLSLSC